MFFMKKTQDLYMIGQSIVCFMEMLTLGIFLFALFTRKDIGMEDESEYLKVYTLDSPNTLDRQGSDKSSLLSSPGIVITTN